LPQNNYLQPTEATLLARTMSIQLTLILYCSWQKA